MRVTSITAQATNANRVNISIDGKYRFSLDVYQIADLGIRVNKEYTEAELVALEQESQFGKLYARALEYCLMRPHSAREVRDYLWRKTRTTRYKAKDGTIKERSGVTKELTERVFERLAEKGYINDESFARFWIENRNQSKGTSLRKLRSELQAKGVEQRIIDNVMDASLRSDDKELQKVLAKKRRKYPDDQKLISYLARQGFSFDAIKEALREE